jgi:hypothetical protein
MAVNGINNSADAETFVDFLATVAANYTNEGIIKGCEVRETDPQSSSVEVQPGKLVINLGSNRVGVYEVTIAETVSIPDNSLNTQSLVLLKVNITDATQTLVALSGATGASTDPTLTESESARYLVLARVTGTGANIVNADITQDGATLTDNATPEIIGRRADITWKRTEAQPTFVSVDDPTGVIEYEGDLSAYIQAGTRIRFDNNGNDIKGIASKDVSVSGGTTTITYLHEIDPGTNGALTPIAAGAITNFRYSNAKAPEGFPTQSSKWTLIQSSTTPETQANAVGSTYYNKGGSLSIPIGDWNLGYHGTFRITDSDATDAGCDIRSTLSTANNTESDAKYSVESLTEGKSVTGFNVSFYAAHRVMRNLVVTTKETRYLNIRTAIASSGNASITVAERVITAQFNLL